MMGRALLIVGALATLGLLATALVAWLYSPLSGETFSLHLLLALGSSLLLLFSHCWIMFYLIGTGKAIKEAVKENAFEEDLVQATIRFKNRSFPWMMVAMGLAMATFILGGGVFNETLPGWVHAGLFWLTLGAQLWTLWIEHQVIAENDRLMSGINRRLAA